MVEPIDLWQEINEKTKKLDNAIYTLSDRGVKLAEAEAKYRVSLSTKIIELRANGNPVSILIELAKGDKEIAQLKQDRDICEAKYKANLEFIQAIKMQLKVLMLQYKEEWGASNEG